MATDMDNLKVFRGNPFLKWPGGKRWLASHLIPLISKNLSGRYFEPFLGGGAIFFRLFPKKAILSDINTDLINTYIQVRDNPDLLIEKLKRKRITENNYYRIRSQELVCPIEKAIRLLFLNRTAFGGIYRENREGRLNVPYGGGRRTPNILWEQGLIKEASRVLQKKKLLVSDFEGIIEKAKKGDVVYCDPTYTVTHNNNGFVRYNERNFSWKDQERLAFASERAWKRGAVVIVSNAHHDSVRKLYPNAKKKKVERASCVSRKVEARKMIFEDLFLFF